MEDTNEINFQIKLDVNFLKAFLQAGEKIGIDPLSSVASEEYFFQLQQKIQDGVLAVVDVTEILMRDFLCVGEPPRWTQNPEWPFVDGSPMIFVGQIDVPEGSVVGNKSFYLFHDKNSSQTEVIAQWD